MGLWWEAGWVLNKILMLSRFYKELSYSKGVGGVANGKIRDPTLRIRARDDEQ